MKKVLFVVAFLNLVGCSSLITRSELKTCQTTCAASKSEVGHISKEDGKVTCECEKLSKQASSYEGCSF